MSSALLDGCVGDIWVGDGVGVDDTWDRVCDWEGRFGELKPVVVFTSCPSEGRDTLTAEAMRALEVEGENIDEVIEVMRVEEDEDEDGRSGDNAIAACAAMLVLAL